MKRITMTLILMIAFTFSGFSQSDKAEDKAENKTEEIADWIETGNEAVALTDDQVKKMEDLFAKMRMDINDLKDEYPDKGDDFKSERKKISKKYYKQINKEVLTKQQRKAKRRGKKMMEDKS